MLAEKDETMCSAAKSIYEIMAEQEAQLELEARERYIKEKKRYKEMEVLRQFCGNYVKMLVIGLPVWYNKYTVFA